MRVGELRALGGDQDVAVQGQFQATGDGHAVDGADHRFRHGRPLRRQVGQFAGAATAADAAAQFLEIHARAERRVGAGENHHVDVVVGLGLGQGGKQTVTQLR